MRIHFILSEEDKNPDAVNNFTVANAIYNTCIGINTSIAEIRPYLDVKTIAKMLLLQCDIDEALVKERQGK